MEDKEVYGWQIISRLIDYLDREDKKIKWDRSCWNGGIYYYEDELKGKLDSEFPFCEYTSDISGLVSLEYNIDKEERISRFILRFKDSAKWERTGINPIPESIVLKAYSKEKSCLPSLQGRYTSFSESDEAFAAMQDFADNGDRLADYFLNIQQESVKEFTCLVQKFKQYRNVRDIVMLG